MTMKIEATAGLLPKLVENGSGAATRQVLERILPIYNEFIQRKRHWSDRNFDPFTPEARIIIPVPKDNSTPYAYAITDPTGVHVVATSFIEGNKSHKNFLLVIPPHEIKCFNNIAYDANFALGDNDLLIWDELKANRAELEGLVPDYEGKQTERMLEEFVKHCQRFGIFSATEAQEKEGEYVIACRRTRAEAKENKTEYETKKAIKNLGPVDAEEYMYGRKGFCVNPIAESNVMQNYIDKRFTIYIPEESWRGEMALFNLANVCIKTKPAITQLSID